MEQRIRPAVFYSANRETIRCRHISPQCKPKPRGACARRTDGQLWQGIGTSLPILYPAITAANLTESIITYMIPICKQIVNRNAPESAEAADRRQWRLSLPGKRRTEVIGQNPGKNVVCGRGAGKKKNESKSDDLLSFWWGRTDSNHRSETQQIYSLSPLATRELPQICNSVLSDWSR